MINDANSRFDDYSISPKIRQVLLAIIGSIDQNCCKKQKKNKTIVVKKKPLSIIKAIKMSQKKKQIVSIRICQKKRKKQKSNIPKIDPTKLKKNNLEIIRMSYYWFNRRKLLEYGWDKCHNKGRKQKAAKYYAANKEILREDARNRYRNLSEK